MLESILNILVNDFDTMPLALSSKQFSGQVIKWGGGASGAPHPKIVKIKKMYKLRVLIVNFLETHPISLHSKVGVLFAFRYLLFE